MAGTMKRLDEIYDAGSARLRAHSAYGVILTVRRKDMGGLLALKTVQARRYGDAGVVLGSERRDDNVGMLQDEIEFLERLGALPGCPPAERNILPMLDSGLRPGNTFDDFGRGGRSGLRHAPCEKSTV